MSGVKGRLEGRVAIVTGASRGIGRATALVFGREGAKVLVNYRRERAKAEEVVEEVERLGGAAMAFRADVGVREEVERMVEAATELGGVDILVNNAGVAMGAGSLLEFNDEEYDPMWRVNVKGVLHCTRAVAPQMMAKGSGKVVNIASVAGLGTALLPGNMLYASTKAAVIILTKRLALELGRYGINVNAIAPGLIRTDMGLGYRSSAEQAGRIQYFIEKSILRRIGEPEEVASVALFLASEEASFITGQVITVDGGRIDFITHSL
ncbi:MAG: SDR family NAD(P)-dependent oxidoreductase [Candidatus Bathyarchaeia archaeon]